MADAPATEDVTLQCPDCEASFTGPPNGRSSVQFKLGAHRARVHKWVNENKTYKGGGKSRRGAQADQERPILAIVGDAADEAARGKGPPTEENLTAALGRGLGVASLAVASYVVETDPTITTEDERDRTTAYLRLSSSASRDLMAPFARAFAPTSLNKRYGRQVVENVDLVGATSDLVLLFLHWRRYFRERDRRMGAAPLGSVASGPMGPVVDADSYDVTTPAGAPAAPPPAPAEQTGPPQVPAAPAPTPGGGPMGVVWTPDMVQRQGGS